MNPVVLLDEVDKVGSDYRGDPAAALLEVLDPAQNHTFRDHYLDLDLDLSDVLFIATANVLDTIPQALFDRMELISIDGYTENDKVAIARDFLVPRQLERAALSADEVTLTEDALREIAANYTREAGVRSFERLLAKAFRKVALRELPVTVDAADLKDLIGRPRFIPSVRAHRGSRRGDRPGGHRDGRRRPLHRGVAAARRQGRLVGHRPARRRDEGVGADRALLRPGARRRARHLAGAARPPDPPARAGGRGAEGRAVGGRHDDDRAGLAAARPQCGPRSG